MMRIVVLILVGLCCFAQSDDMAAESQRAPARRSALQGEIPCIRRNFWPESDGYSSGAQSRLHLMQVAPS